MTKIADLSIIKTNYRGLSKRYWQKKPGFRQEKSKEYKTTFLNARNLEIRGPNHFQYTVNRKTNFHRPKEPRRFDIRRKFMCISLMKRPNNPLLWTQVSKD